MITWTLDALRPLQLKKDGGLFVQFVDLRDTFKRAISAQPLI